MGNQTYTQVDLDELERLLDKAEWPKYDGQDGAVLRALIQRVRDAERRASIETEAAVMLAASVELYGEVPYDAARNWHAAWMNSEARVAKLERVREAARSYLSQTGLTHLVSAQHLYDALAELDARK